MDNLYIFTPHNQESLDFLNANSDTIKNIGGNHVCLTKPHPDYVNHPNEQVYEIELSPANYDTLQEGLISIGASDAMTKNEWLEKYPYPENELL